MTPAIMRQLSVRRFRDADLPDVLAIEQTSFGPDAWPREFFVYYRRQCPGLFLVAHTGDGIAGYCTAVLTQSRAEIASLAVQRGYRGRGVATLLLQSVFRRARQAGARSIWLMVRRGNAPAISLYQRLGFVRVRTVAGYYEDGEAGWRMQLIL